MTPIPFGRAWAPLAVAAFLAVNLSVITQAAPLLSKTRSGAPVPSQTDVVSVSPALAAYAEATLLGEVWKRPGLSARDRSLITVAALIARNQTVELPYYFKRALDNGVRPSELSEIIFHLAFYSGWPNATAAVMVAKDIFAERGVHTDQLPSVSPKLLSIDPVGEQKRVARVEADVGPVSPGLVEYTGSLCCSMTSGCDPIWHRAIGVSSP